MSARRTFVNITGPDTTRDDDWRDSALCSQTGIDDATWFPSKGSPTTQARAICRLCPVAAECLAYAQERPGIEGVWGGLSERQRQKLRTRARVGNDLLDQATREATA